ncbi:GAF and ANTAR domain-containing protein [Phytoactinopolyspora limicola]|uniref:GAF and ANTAR domain-containing protein n=1 Tax=Phytoactinopolyspora limicola TaxID=2715536 RepID=UPI00140A864D|nr:GAF and ANTAR domain-containing protein [Phytoactinopolyspora limicola]
MHHSLSVELATLARELHSDLDVTETVETILQHTPTITGCSQASIMLGDERPRQVASATDARAERADRYQLQLGEGPAVAVMSRHEPVVVRDIPADPRWSRWTSEAARMGLRGVLSVRLGTERTTLGALTLYSSESGWFGPDHVASANLCARLASVAVASTQRISVLRRAVDDRTVIGQAQGVLQARHGIDAERAFTMLLAYARTHRIEVSDAAEAVVSGRVAPGGYR